MLSPTLSDGDVGLALEANKPSSNANKDKVWSAAATSGSVSSHFEPKRVSKSSSHNPHSGGSTYFENYVAVPKDTATVDLKGMNFTSGDVSNQYDSKMNYERKKSYPFKYGSRSKICGFSCGKWSSIGYKHHSLKVTITMNANFKFTVQGSGQNQEVQLEVVESTNPIVDGEVEPPAGLCKTSDHDLQQAYLSHLKASIEPELISLFSRKFSSISVFALKNILFPDENFIDLKQVNVPGDMVVFGTITKGT